jgi:hypothetical protein
VWHRQLWLIDHGASLYFHHAWQNVEESSRGAFPAIKEHVLLPWAARIAEVDAELTAMLDQKSIAKIVDLVPDEWLGDVPGLADHRKAYVDWFLRRLEGPRLWVEEAVRARAMLV